MARRGQRPGFRHSEESKAKISAAFKGGPPRGGFAIRVTCEGCGREMNAANLTRHKPACDTFGNYTKERKQLRRVLRRMGTDLDTYDLMVETQAGLCAICRRPPRSNGRDRLAIDHDHATGVFRGLLCDQCNMAIGLLDDDPTIVESALRYLVASREGHDHPVVDPYKD